VGVCWVAFGVVVGVFLVFWGCWWLFGFGFVFLVWVVRWFVGCDGFSVGCFVVWVWVSGGGWVGGVKRARAVVCGGGLGGVLVLGGGGVFCGVWQAKPNDWGEGGGGGVV